MAQHQITPEELEEFLRLFQGLAEDIVAIIDPTDACEVAIMAKWQHIAEYLASIMPSKYPDV